MRVYVKAGTDDFLGISDDGIYVDYHQPQGVYQLDDASVLAQKIRADVGRLKRCIIQGGALVDALPYIYISGSMQLTISNGDYNGQALSLPLADRQIDLVADPTYDTLIEIAIIRDTATGALNIWHRENEGAMLGGYELIQSLLKFTLPAGTTDLRFLNLF